MTTVAVTGANGFIGSHLTEALLAEGHRVRVMVRPTSDLQWIDQLPVERVPGDLDDTAAMRRLVEGCSAVFHLAAKLAGRTYEELHEVNVEGTDRLLTQVAQHAGTGSRFVYLSSQEVLGVHTGSAPADETTPLRPITDYGKSKVAAEERVRSKTNVTHTIIRPSPVFGPRDRDVFPVFRLVDSGVVPQFRRDGKVSVLSVTNLVNAIVTAAGAPEAAGGTFYIADPEPLDWSHLVRVLRREINPDAVLVPIGDFPLRTAAELGTLAARYMSRPPVFNRQKYRIMLQPNLAVSVRHAVETFAYAPVLSTAEGIRQTAAWYRQAGWIT